MKTLARGILGVLAVVLALAVILFPSAPRPNARAYVHKLAAERGAGSGVVLRPGLVLTARHVAVVEGLKLAEKGAVGVKTAVSTGAVDLGLLYFPSREATCPCVQLAEREAQPGETVYVVGYPLGIAQVLTVGTAQAIKEHAVVPGMFGFEEDFGHRLFMT